MIGATFYGSKGAVALSNVDGSYDDFALDEHRGTTTRRLVEPPDAWGGRAAVDWARRLAAGERFDARGAEEHVVLARVIDRIYGR